MFTIHELFQFTQLSIIGAAVGWSVKKVLDWALTEEERTRKAIIKTHVKSRHDERLDTCQKDGCSSLQTPAMTELLGQEVHYW